MLYFIQTKTEIILNTGISLILTAMLFTRLQLLICCCVVVDAALPQCDCFHHSAVSSAGEFFRKQTTQNLLQVWQKLILFHPGGGLLIQ